MIQEIFEFKINELLLNGSIKEIDLLFKKQKHLNIKKNFFKLHSQKIKKYLFKDDTYQFDVLGITVFNQHDFVFNQIKNSLKNKRTDYISYLCEKNYINIESINLFLNRILEFPPDLLKMIISNKFIKPLFNESILSNAYIRCAMTDNIDTFEVLLEYISPNFKLMNDILITAAEYNSNIILKNTLSGKYNIDFDINTKKDEFTYDGNIKRYNILIHACNNKNKEILEFLFTTKIKKIPELSEGYSWIIQQKEGRKMIEYLILELDIPYSDNTKDYLIYYKDIKFIEMFEKRDMKKALEEKLPIKNKYIKPRKI